ncbi:MAG: hypothetical protein CM1200mP5_3300 [Candidatus Pelagibacterales bacterium]|nr:MAG: hypothetical protein CM1200mP5_3300 [Pelagibacterales bacterium]
MNDKRQGIVHIIGPEQGFTQPGTIIVCGDSQRNSWSFWFITLLVLGNVRGLSMFSNPNISTKKI